MLSSLLLTSFLMGLSGMAHCAAMCGAACAVAFPRGLSPWALVGRAIGYALLGALAAFAAGVLSQWGRQVAMLKPIWLMAQVAVVIFGASLLINGRVPPWLDQLGRPLYDHVRQRWASSNAALPMWVRPTLPLAGGLAWALLPCGLLYAALMVSALAPDPVSGALVMLAFAMPSAVGVWAAPALLNWLRRRGQTQAAEPVGIGATVPVIWMRNDAAQPDPSTRSLNAPPASLPSGSTTRAWWAADVNWLDPRWAVRLSGLCLAGMAGWGVAHNLWAQWQAWCA